MPKNEIQDEDNIFFTYFDLYSKRGRVSIDKMYKTDRKRLRKDNAV